MPPAPVREASREAVLAALAQAQAVLATGDLNVSFRLEGEPGGRVVRARALAARTNPKVSCLMVTRGDPEQIAHAVQCYARQTWANRELIVVTEPNAVPGVEALLARSGAPNCFIAPIGGGLALGDLRNAAIARATGDIVMQWDDDDLYDPLRIALAVSVLKETGAAAAVMSRWLIWWPARRLAAVSDARHWEGTLAVWRAHAPVYPAQTRSEDAKAFEALYYTRQIAVFDAPLQYVYAVHGRNTWDEAHFEGLLADAGQRFEGEAYDALNAILAERMPILSYEAYLKERGP
jgi:hypothetical protein